MSTIIDTISNLQNLNHLTPATLDEIKKAENDLKLTFADDFKEYVQNYGAISAKGVELTGITVSKRLDVVSVTKTERELSSIPNGMYVIENMAIDGLLILQDSTGAIYSIAPHMQPQKVCASLAEYISQKCVE